MHIRAMRATVLLSVFLFLAAGCDSSAGSAVAGQRDRPPAEPNAVTSPPHALPPERIYEVHKKVCDFPDREDLSTPEAAYATIHRTYARQGNAAWLRFSTPQVAAAGVVE